MEDDCPCNECLHLLDGSPKCSACIKTYLWMEFERAPEYTVVEAVEVESLN